MFRTLGKIIEHQRVTQEYPVKKPDASLFIGCPEVTAGRCTGCGECVRRCPSNAIEAIPGSRGIDIDFGKCVVCTLCEEICPEDAIKMTNRYELAQKDKKTLRSAALTIRDGHLPDISDEELHAELSHKIKKIFGRSLQIREVDAGSCNGCDYEINALNNPFNDIERLGIHFVASPRHADMLLVTGTASRNMEQALLKTYHATPDPKLVVAVGACACSGGIFSENYAVNKGIDCLVSVDVYIPGCPPRPQAILYGILKALDRVK